MASRIPLLVASTLVLLCAACTAGPPPQAGQAPDVIATTTPSPSPTASVTASTTAPPTPTPASSAPADPAQAEKEIKENWQRFFSQDLKTQDKVKLVQDGELNELMVRAFAEDERTGRMISRVADVTFTSATDAKVTFSLFRNSTTVLPRGRGTVVLQDDVWKMSFRTLCVLTEYGQDVPQAGTC